jgi:hypothetical protein
VTGRGRPCRTLSERERIKAERWTEYATAGSLRAYAEMNGISYSAARERLVSLNIPLAPRGRPEKADVSLSDEGEES